MVENASLSETRRDEARRDEAGSVETGPDAAAGAVAARESPARDAPRQQAARGAVPGDPTPAAKPPTPGPVEAADPYSEAADPDSEAKPAKAVNSKSVLDAIFSKKAVVPVAREPRDVYVVANRTGGQGKTLLSQLLVALLPDATVYAADSVGDGGCSKLASILLNRIGSDDVDGVPAPGSPLAPAPVPELRPVVVHDLGIGWSEDEVRGMGESMFWDKLGDLLIAGGDKAVVDMGANVVTSFIAWGDAFKAKGLFQGASPVRFTFVVPFVASPQAIADAKAVVASLHASAAQEGFGLPVHRVLLVRNAWQGKFDALLSAAAASIIPDARAPIEAAAAKEAEAAEERSRSIPANGKADVTPPRPCRDAVSRLPTSSTFHLDVADALVARLFEEILFPVGNIRYMDESSFAAIGVNFIQANRSGKRFRDWFNTTLADLRKVLTPPVENKASQVDQSGAS